MKKKNLFLFILLILCPSFFYCSTAQQGMIKKLMAKMVSRQVKDGVSGMIKGDIFYDYTSSKMITHFTYPLEYVMIANNKGELSIHNPHDNKVVMQQNFAYSTESSQLYYFLSHQMADMGLKKMNYSIQKTSIEKDLIITEWKCNIQAKKGDIEKIKLVHRNQNPIYMSYIDTKGKILRKVFYSSYQAIGNVYFPTSTTEIVYDDKKDSTINKIIYSDLVVNEQANSPYFNYKIPTDAIIEK
jgi:hypothetical protein